MITITKVLKWIQEKFQVMIACSSHEIDDALKIGKSANKGTLINLVACDYIMSNNAIDERISQVEKCLKGS